jgi:redox-sensitive bicupin YhaK (pirin superfamily)
MQLFRPSEDRGRAEIGWLDSRHSFSFGNYYDPDHIQFGALRVINEDRVSPGAGFDTHGHKDMEIISYVLEGALEHKDSIGTGSVIRPGELQRMTAGTGIRHSEFNPSETEPVHFLQIWIVPEREGLEPGYEQKVFPAADRQGMARLLGSRDGRDGSLTIHQDVDVYGSLLGIGEAVAFDLRPGRKLWIQMARGTLTANGQPLSAGDGLGLLDTQNISITATDEAEFLLFDLAA